MIKTNFLQFLKFYLSEIRIKWERFYSLKDFYHQRVRKCGLSSGFHVKSIVHIIVKVCPLNMSLVSKHFLRPPRRTLEQIAPRKQSLAITKASENGGYILSFSFFESPQVDD